MKASREDIVLARVSLAEIQEIAAGQGVPDLTDEEARSFVEDYDFAPVDYERMEEEIAGWVKAVRRT